MPKPFASFARLACLTIAAAATTVGATACSDDPGSGTLTLDYEFGINAEACEIVGVERVRVTLGDTNKTDDCMTPGEVNLSGIKARNYNDLLVEGLDGGDVTIFDNLDTPDGDESVEIIGGASQQIEVTLTPTPATIAMTFSLLDDNGLAYLGMAESPVTSFTVVPAEGTSSPFLTHEFQVSQLPGSMVDVPDEERDIDGEALDTIRVSFEAGPVSGTIDGDPNTPGEQAFLLAPPGHGRTVSIRIDCMGSVCTGQLTDVSAPVPTTGTASATGGTPTGGDDMSTGGELTSGGGGSSSSGG